MKGEITFFRNQEFGVIRAVEIDGEPWFAGKDVAASLGYSNTKDALISHVDEEDKRIIQRSEIATLENNIPQSVLPVNFVSADIPNRGLTIINESGLYSLILSSKLPRAKAFKRWVTSEVIPSIRKHGAYMTLETAEQMISNPDFMIRLLQELKSEQEQRRELERQKKEDAPKVLFADAVKTSRTSILVGELAKILKQNGVETGQTRLFSWLRDNGFLIKRKGSDYNMPTQKAMEAGLFEIKETAVTHADGHVSVNRTPKVTGKGQLYFVERFLSQKE